jgi:aspartate-semialdehyde dehydrogenase
MKKLGFVGFRGMVGQVLMERMEAHGVFKNFQVTFYSTSQRGQTSPHKTTIEYAYDLSSLMGMDLILTCQGGEYSQKVYPELMEKNFKGYWIDASSAFRMREDATLLLDPVNSQAIERAIIVGKKLFVGANCTVSLMLLALAGLFKEDLIEWVSSMTYQAASGAGAAQLTELLSQSQFMTKTWNASENILSSEKNLHNLISDKNFPQASLGYPLNFNLLPWIDSGLENGQTKEEWKAVSEGNKILESQKTIPIDGTCVRVGALRCHSQALTIKLKRDISLMEIESKIKKAHEWIRFVDNNKEDTIKGLTPFSISGTLEIAVGRVRKMNLGPEYLNVFTCGDQLLWGAAEPLVRFLKKL